VPGEGRSLNSPANGEHYGVRDFAHAIASAPETTVEATVVSTQ
jgi:hypothetical protein